jgi:hypothetical protein
MQAFSLAPALSQPSRTVLPGLSPRLVELLSEAAVPDRLALVGGAVRDLLRHRLHNDPWTGLPDLDLVVEGLALLPGGPGQPPQSPSTETTGGPALPPVADESDLRQCAALLSRCGAPATGR